VTRRRSRHRYRYHEPKGGPRVDFRHLSGDGVGSGKEESEGGMGYGGDLNGDGADTESHYTWATAVPPWYYLDSEDP